MTTVYKLADGSLSSDYETGDTFLVVQYAPGRDIVPIDFTVDLSVNDGSGCPPFKCKGFSKEPRYVRWICLTPTEETKRKVAERKADDAKKYDFGALPEVEKKKIFEQFGSAYKAVISERANSKAPPMPKCKPAKTDNLACIVDWRGGESVDNNDIVICGRSITLSYAIFKERGGALGTAGWNTVIRINTDALPKQRIITRAEAEKELNARIID